MTKKKGVITNEEKLQEFIEKAEKLTDDKEYNKLLDEYYNLIWNYDNV
tara:strand:+ start:17 stop:160 length:144 start_codon:yes stop_codon:yes gene_type:complete